ncbi:hypothetical protein D3C73_1420650 [compost metagenome]
MWRITTLNSLAFSGSTGLADAAVDADGAGVADAAVFVSGLAPHATADAAIAIIIVRDSACFVFFILDLLQVMISYSLHF